MLGARCASARAGAAAMATESESAMRADADAVDACPPHAITMRGRQDGFGAHLAAMISVYSWAKRRRVPYCSSRWRRVEHASNGSNLFDFVGGPRYGPAATASTSSVLEMHAQLAAAAAWKPNASRWAPDARRYYHETPKPPLSWYGMGAHHMAVHVRRGDVSYARYPGRFTPLGLIAQCVVGALRRLAPKRAAHVHVFSEGRAADFEMLTLVPNAKVHLHLGAPLMATFHHMAMADSLVMASSTLSDTAAFLSRGRVFAHPSARGQLGYMHHDLRIEPCV